MAAVQASTRESYTPSASRAMLGDQPSTQPGISPNTYVVPTAILMLGALLLVVSIFLPYWQLTLHAPQYPKGLKVELYVNRVTGDVREIDGLNHYIGMRKLEEAAPLERSIAGAAVFSLATLLLAAVFIHNRWAAVLALPVLAFPGVFLADLFFWMYRYGRELDPKAALSSSIRPFTPTLLGEGNVGQFRTTAGVTEGFYLAVAAGVVVLIGLYFHRRAYKPLFDAKRFALSVQDC